ncbi:MAG: ferredoxin--NADP reductase [Betaproteobacteria bacterium]
MSHSPEHATPAQVPENQKKSSEETVNWVHQWNPDLMSFRIGRPADFVFTPGQYARIGLRLEDGTEMWRPYSIASAPHQKFLEFFLVTARGEFSKRISTFQPGSKVLLEHEPKGYLSIDRFRQPQQEQDLWLLGTGTGLSPFLSLLRDATAFWRFEHIVLVVSVRESADLGYAEELERIAASCAQDGNRRFHYLKSFTREEKPGAAHGRINVLLNSGELEKRLDLPISVARSRFMLSGNPEMITGVTELLGTQGFRLHRASEPGHIIVENYW